MFYVSKMLNWGLVTGFIYMELLLLLIGLCGVGVWTCNEDIWGLLLMKQSGWGSTAVVP